VPPEIHVIGPNRSARHSASELWRYRELFYFLAWRDIKVRYKQTAIGVAWSVLRPLLSMIVLTVVFGRLANLPSGNVPYPIMVFAAMLPWQFFANALSDSSASLVNSANLVTKVYFPRLIVPTSAVVVSAVDFLISAVLLAVLMGAYRFAPTWKVVALPLFLLLAVGAATGAGIWMAALNVRYRDFRFLVPFVIQFGLYVSPVGYVSAVVPGRWRLLYSLNPMVGVIDGFRWAICGGDHTLYVPGLLASTAIVLVLLATGLVYFRRVELGFADII